MQTVYRLENDKNIGPYQSPPEYEEWYSDMMREHMNNAHPNKWEDFSKGHEDEYVYGFSSLEGVKSWFKGYLPQLLKAGFKIMTYNSNDVLIGESKLQLVFIPIKESGCIIYIFK